MSTKDTTPREWPDPTDFGLPFVEITPLSSAKPSSKVDAIKAVEPIKQVEAISKPPKKEEKEVKTSRPIVPPSTPPKEKKSASRAWVWIVVFGFLAVISVVIWQLQSGNFAFSGSTEKESTSEPISLAESNTIPPIDTTQSQVVSGIDSTATTNSSISGTTIAPSSTGTLIRVNSKEAYPRFFVIIGSFGSEQETLRYIENLNGRFPEYHLIAPYDQNKNFRLAIGKYTSWNEASVELERVKLAYPKDLWILNY